MCTVKTISKLQFFGKLLGIDNKNNNRIRIRISIICMPHSNFQAFSLRDLSVHTDGQTDMSSWTLLVVLI